MTTGKFTLVIRWPSGQSTICGEMTDHQHGEICRILSPDYRAKQPSQGGEAVEVVEVIAMYDKNAASSADAFRWPSMVQGQSWREPVMTVAQHQRILAASVGSAEPVAYAAFADNGNIRMWCRSAIGMCELIDEHGNKAVPLYTHPAAPECGCCGQTGECDDDCDSRILYLAGTPSCPAWM